MNYLLKKNNQGYLAHVVGALYLILYILKQNKVLIIDLKKITLLF